jgi:hypothetical protein
MVSPHVARERLCPPASEIDDATGLKWNSVEIDAGDKRHSICGYKSASGTATIVPAESGRWDLEFLGGGQPFKALGATKTSPTIFEYDPKAQTITKKTATPETTATASLKGAQCRIDAFLTCLKTNKDTGKDCLACAAGVASAFALGNPIPAAIAGKDCLQCGFRVVLCLFKTAFRSKCK